MTNKKDAEHRRLSVGRRRLELFLVFVVVSLLVGLSQLETRLFSLSENLAKNAEFLTSVIYFGLINFNVILILILSFMIFRNVARLVVERRRGILGSRLRTRLITALVLFAVAPAALMFYISSAFITTSFDTWFSKKVQTTIQQTREVGAQIYRQDQRRLEGLSRLAIEKVKVKENQDLFPGQLPEIDYSRLAEFASDYKVDALSLYNANGEFLWSTSAAVNRENNDSEKSFFISAINSFYQKPKLKSVGAVDANEASDTVKGVGSIVEPISGRLVGVVVLEEHFETQLLGSIETILADFSNLRPSAQLIRLNYQILLLVMLFIIVFASTWMGFYVSRGIVDPIQRLAEATREVALGNYNFSIAAEVDDETGALIRAFNMMNQELKSHGQKQAEFTRRLQESNYALNERRQYIEIVLENITSGVVALDAEHRVSSSNHAADRLLKGKGKAAIGESAISYFGKALWVTLFEPLIDRLSGERLVQGQVDVGEAGIDSTLLVSMSRIFGESGQDLGVLLVFDDATEQVKVQKVAAWKEVARRMAHEIKNPITPIKLSAQRLLRRYENNFSGEDKNIFSSCIQTILVHVDSLRDLVNEFSRFSRMPTVRTARHQINKVVIDAARMFSLSYPNVKFDFSALAQELPEIPLDKEQVHRVFLNLISNSIAAMEGSKAKIRRIEFSSMVIEELRSVKVSITDSGPGFPEKNREKLFEPYFSTKAEGTGLGLSIVQQIISDHGGYVRLSNSKEGGGTVILEFPLGPVVNELKES